MRLEYLSKHLLSGAAVYVIVAACSASDDRASFKNAAGHGGATPDAPNDQGTGGSDMIDGSGGDQILDALAETGADVLDAIGDPVRDATAQEGGCGTCTVNGPVKTITADSDLNQLVGGRLDVPDCVSGSMQVAAEVAVGPFVLTDVRPIYSGGTVLYTVADNEPCTPFPSTVDTFVMRFVAPGNDTSSGFPPLSGGRLLIPAGRKLCARDEFCGSSTYPTDIYWSGFRPYT